MTDANIFQKSPRFVRLPDEKVFFEAVCLSSHNQWEKTRKESGFYVVYLINVNK